MFAEIDARGLKEVQSHLAEAGFDGWLLYDFQGQNPTALTALGAGAAHLTRRWFYLVPARGEPTLLLHKIESTNLPALPGRRILYASWKEMRTHLVAAVSAANIKRVAMEYCPMATIPYLSRVDAGTIELVKACGIGEIGSSADLVQHFLCRWSLAQLASHTRAAEIINAAKDAAFDLIGQRVREGRPALETEVQDFLMELFAEAKLETDHPPIVAVNEHAGAPHYAPTPDTAVPAGEGDLVLIDLWAKEIEPNAVYADITWMAHVGGRPSPRQVEAFGLIASARDAGLEHIRTERAAGRCVRGFEVDQVVRSVVEKGGFGDYFVHRTGHSIGTNVHGDGANLDDFETHDTRELVPGLAFSIEPGIYLPEWGVRTEIDVYVSEEEPEVYTPIQQEIVPIEV